MKRQYSVGNKDDNVSATVNVGTRGIAYTAMYQVRSGGQSALIVDSASVDGRTDGTIPLVAIGSALTLASSYILVRTLIDLSHITDADERASDANNIVVYYTFTGGFSGTQTYNHDNDDITMTPDKKLVTITKAIEML
jgi:hypothetical protein